MSLWYSTEKSLGKSGYVSEDEEKLEQDIKSLKVNKLYLDITVDTFIHN